MFSERTFRESFKKSIKHCFEKKSKMIGQHARLRDMMLKVAQNSFQHLYLDGPL